MHPQTPSETKRIYLLSNQQSGLIHSVSSQQKTFSDIRFITLRGKIYLVRSIFKEFKSFFFQLHLFQVIYSLLRNQCPNLLKNYMKYSRTLNLIGVIARFFFNGESIKALLC